MKQVSQETMDAMKQLLEHYKNPKEELEDCPLCTLHKDKGEWCETCPWSLFGYKSTSWHVHCNSWVRTLTTDINGISPVRLNPSLYPAFRKKRINMLVQWIRNSEVV